MPAGRRVGQRLERDQRAHDRLAPRARGRCSGSTTRRHQASVSASGPVGVERPAAAGWCDGYQVEHERRPARPRADRELGHGASGPRPAAATGRAQAQRRPGPAIARSAAVGAPDPGDDRAVVEADDQLHAHRHPARDGPRRCRTTSGSLCARRHAVDDRAPRPSSVVELGLQHQGVAAGSGAGPRGPRSAGASSQRPCSGVPSRAAKQAGRVEAGQAQPVDRAVRGRPGRRSGSRRSARSPRWGPPSVSRGGGRRPPSAWRPRPGGGGWSGPGPAGARRRPAGRRPGAP